MKRFELTEEALADVQDIWEYISQGSFDAAELIVEEFYQVLAGLAETPRKDISGGRHQTRCSFLGVQSYLVIYKRDSDPLEIVAIFHGQRNIRSSETADEAVAAP